MPATLSSYGKLRLMNENPSQRSLDGTARYRVSLRDLRSKVTGVSWLALIQTSAPVLILCALGVYLALHFGGPAPPRSITIASGPKGSNFEAVAIRYQQFLKRNGIQLNIVHTEGSLENLRSLSDAREPIDSALVQSGLTLAPADTAPGDAARSGNVVSLGSVAFQPLDIFYRSAKPLGRLSDLKGDRIAIGPEGSGTRALSLALLQANGIEQGVTEFTADEGEGARKALLKHQVDAIFLTGDSASGATIREMLHTDGVRLFDFQQADGYARRFPYLNKLVVPAGTFDLGENLPTSDITLMAPTVELLARENLHPALVDLLIEAAEEVNGRASLLQSAGQFPTATLHSWPINDEAVRYYKSGNKGVAYRYLPFWLASLVNRLIVVLVPVLVVLIPGLRLLPALYRWRVASKIHRRYGELMAVEREALGPLSDERRRILLERLDEVERSVISHKMPGSIAEQVYILREHIHFVRKNMGRNEAAHIAHSGAGAHT
jgi:TRAP transporter TAXI family solute receptor